jgi:hypothetical protein
MTGEAANDNLSQLRRLRARAARILRPKEAQAVRDLHALRKRLRKEGGDLMAKKKGRHANPRPAGPDDPIYQRGLVIFTPMSARPGYQRPEPKEEPEVEKEPPKE